MPETASPEKTAEPTKPVPADQLVETKHALTLGGQTLNYTVTAGTMVLKEEEEKKGEEAGKSEGEKPKASFFFIAYTRAADAPSEF